MSAKGFKGRGRPSQETIERVELPTTVKCVICNKNKLLARYSNNQLKKYKEQIYFSGALRAERPRCLQCTGNPSSELQCVQCGVYKSLEAFSKNARSKDRDNAHCWDCQQRVSDQEPNVEDAMKEAEIEEEYHSKANSTFSMSSIGSSLPSGSKSSSNGTPSETGTEESGHVWIQQPLSPAGRAVTSRGRNHRNASKENSRRRSGSQDSAGTADTQETVSTVKSNGTWADLGYDNSNRAPRSGTSQSGTTDKWHKQGAVKKTAREKAAAAVERSSLGPQNQQRPKDSDSDSDSEYEM